MFFFIIIYAKADYDLGFICWYVTRCIKSFVPRLPLLNNL